MTLCIQFFKSWLDTISIIKSCQIYFDWHGVHITKLDDVIGYGFIASISWWYQRFFAVKLTKKHLAQSVACADEDETLDISEDIQLDYWTINTFNTNTVSRSNLHYQTSKAAKQETEFSDISVTMFQIQ